MFSNQVMSYSFTAAWNVAHQATLSLVFPRQEYWSELLFPSPGDLPWPRDQACVSCSRKQILYHWATWEFKSKFLADYILQNFMFSWNLVAPKYYLHHFPKKHTGCFLQIHFVFTIVLMSCLNISIASQLHFLAVLRFIQVQEMVEKRVLEPILLHADTFRPVAFLFCSWFIAILINYYCSVTFPKQMFWFCNRCIIFL